MADFKPFFKKLMVHEGGWSNNPADKGGPTKYGVILKEWIDKGWDKDHDGDIDVNDLKIITLDDAAKIAKPYYWDKLRADEIRNQSFAELLVDFAYNSGVVTAAKKVQKLLDLEQDGQIGPKSIAKINSVNQEDLFNKFKQMRKNFYIAIIANNPSQKVFEKGWFARIDSFKYVC